MTATYIVFAGFYSPITMAEFDPVNDDTDIFLANPELPANRPNVLIILDNTANWSRNVGGQSIAINELSALSNVVNNLDDEFNIGLMLFPETGAGNDNVDGGYLRFGIRQMDNTNRTSLANIVAGLDQNGDKGNNNTVSLAMMEAYRYFAGKDNRASHGKEKTDYDGNDGGAITTPFEEGLGDYPLPASPNSTTNYVSPITDACRDSFIIYISNGAANENASALSVSETELSSLGYDTNNIISINPDGQEGNWMDEWAYYMANSDVNDDIDGDQHVYSYVVEVDPQTTGNNDDMTALLKSVALKGEGSYFAVSSANSGAGITNALNEIFSEIQAVNSVFASTTLPVSVNVRGTNLNQVYIGVFRPDAEKSPRWFGNLKMYQLGFDNTTDTLFLADSTGAAAENSTTGFVDPNATSFHSSASTFWSFRDADENGAGGGSDAPDGDLVEKGGIAQNLRDDHASDQSSRNLYTCTSSCGVGDSLSSTTFDVANAEITNAGLGLGSIAISTLTGFQQQDITSISDQKQAEFASAPGVSVQLSSLTSVINNLESVSSITTSSPAALEDLTNNATTKSISSLNRGSGGSKNIATLTAADSLGSQGSNITIHVSGVASNDYNGTFTATITTANGRTMTYDTGNSNPTNNPTITGATVSVTSSLVTGTLTGHTFSPGDQITIAGVTPTSFNGTETITSVSGNTFTYSTAPTQLSPVTDITGATVAGPSTTATVTLSDAPGSVDQAATTGYSVGSFVTISGATPTEYNGTFAISSIDNAGANFKFTYEVGAQLNSASGTITAAIGNFVTADTLVAHGLGLEDVTIQGATQTAYNGVFTATAVDADTFTYFTKKSTTTLTATTSSTLFETPVSSFGDTGFITFTDHGLVTGDSIVITGATPGTYNGTWTITKIDDDSFSWDFGPGAGPSAAVTVEPSFRLNNASGTALAIAPSHGYSTGDTLVISGAANTEYNGTFTITQTTADTFRYTMATLAINVQGDAGGTIVADKETTTAQARVVNHGFTTGNTVDIAGASPATFNGSFTVTVTDTDNFTYTIASAEGDASGSMTASSGSGSSGDRANLINWVRGADNQEDENNNGSNTDIRASIHSDVLHSRPAVVNYNRHGNDDDVYIFYGSNDGIFRGVKGGVSQSDVGEPQPFTEVWGFVAEEYFSQFSRLRNNEPIISSSNKKPYFFDGSIGTYTNDVNNDGVLNHVDGDQVWIFISMRRGSRTLYALDVSNPIDPKLLWRKTNNSTGWAELGQTWSAPIVTTLAVDTDGGGAADDDDEDVVVIFGAGYDAVVEDLDPANITAFNEDQDDDGQLEVEDNAANYERSMGRGIFVVDASDGDIIWQAGPSYSNPGTHTFLSVSDMDYAIPSDIVVLSDKNSSVDNRVYVGDTGGQLWRADIGDSDPSNWTVTKIASIADHSTVATYTDPDDPLITYDYFPGVRKFLFPPDVVYTDDGFDAVLIGTGDREHPFDTGVENRFYMFKDTSIGATVDVGFTLISEASMYDATDNCIQECNDADAAADEVILDGADGWYIELDDGEKVVGNAVTLNNVTFFNTNVPSSVVGSSTACTSDLGEARQYKVQFSNATAIGDQNIDGSTDSLDRFTKHAGGGYLPSPVPVVVEINGEIHEGVISGVAVEQPPGSTLNTRLRKFWFKESDQDGSADAGDDSDDDGPAIQVEIGGEIFEGGEFFVPE